MLQEQTVVGDCYILQSRVGEDACSEHWMATAIFSAKRFLLRFLKSEYAIPEKVEALRKRALESYHIRGETIKDFVEIEDFEGRFFISSEYYDERSLSEFFSFGYTMSLVHICRSIRMAAQGLLCFHDVGILYGNLTPENIVVEIRGRELASLKIVKPSLSCDSSAQSLAYLAPECKEGKTFSAGSDIYSLGILVVRFITGIYPYENDEISRVNPSLRYVTNALFRRGIPEKMLRIVLGMLMPSPLMRYDSCAPLLRDLQNFMSFPEDSIKRELAPIEIRAAVKSQPTFRTFDTTDYFSALSNGEHNLEHANDRIYPVRSITELSDAEKTESDELRILPEEENWSIDDYIAYGKRIVSGIHEGLTSRETESEAMKNEVTEMSAPPVQSAQSVLAPAVIAPESVKQSVEKAEPVVPRPAPISVGNPDPNIVGVNQLTVKEDSNADKRTWAYHRIKVKDVFNIILRSAQLASRGKGSFRYIQEPESGYASTSFYESLERLSESTLYVNVGSCARYGTASVDDFLAMLMKAIAAALAKESRASVLRFAKKVSISDRFGRFRNAPLGRVLYGAAEIEPAVPIPTDEGTLQSVADSICAFARKKKPLVLVVRGGERISRELQNFFTVLTRTVPMHPVCVVIFFDHIAFESWHTLSLLSKPQRFDIAG
jgi:Protein kinase domain.